jgi:hypothetical protein
MTNQERKNEGWKFVTELRKNGVCGQLEYTEDEASSLSSGADDEESDTASIDEEVPDETTSNQR